MSGNCRKLFFICIVSFVFLFNAAFSVFASSGSQISIKIAVVDRSSLYQDELYRESYLSNFIDVISRYSEWNVELVNVRETECADALASGKVDIVPFMSRSQIESSSEHRFFLMFLRLRDILC